MKRKNHQSRFKGSKVAVWNRQDIWPCPKNNKMIGRRRCWLINNLFHTKRYGNFDCWQCPNILNLRRASYKHKPDIYIGLIAAIVVLLGVGGIATAIWLLRSITP